MYPLHLGPLHPAEEALTYGLAFGPFVLLAVVIVVRRRLDAREEETDRSTVDAGDGGDDGDDPGVTQPRAR